MALELAGAAGTGSQRHRPPTEDRPPRRGTEPPADGSLGGLIAKIMLLGLVAAIALWAAFPLVEDGAWIGLTIVVAVTAALFYIYLTPRRVPLKYLVPGTLFLIAFQILPVLYTVSTAFSNFGDGHRGSKDDAIVAIQTASVKQVPGSAEYTLSVGVGDGERLVFLLSDGTGKAFVGDAAGLKALDPADVTISLGKITAVRGYTVLSLPEANARAQEVEQMRVPTDGGAIRSTGFTAAYEGRAAQRYDAGCDCVIDDESGRRWIADPELGSFVDDQGERLPQGWRVGVGLANFGRVVTDPSVSGPFFGALGWNLVFAVGSMGTQFVLGLLCALALHTSRIRGRNVYRLLLVLPYAMPGFAMLLVWRDMFNTDFGLINRFFGFDVDWMGQPWSARFAVIMVQLWMGYPYMFLVATGALQAIPKEMTEAASVDGATAWQSFRRVTLPLLLVALSPLLIASFAFNFNNFNAIYLVTEGGPFPADNPDVGATDLLITYTYRLAFGGQGAQFGFAAAVSVYIFVIVAVISAISFRRTRRLEDVYS